MTVLASSACTSSSPSFGSTRRGPRRTLADPGCDREYLSAARRVRRLYDPDLVNAAPAQRLGMPRPGHGTVYIHTEGGTPRYPDITYAAEWIDDYGLPNANGEVAGLSRFDATRQQVLDWARMQPAAERLIPRGDGWIPLPTDDTDVRLRGDD